MILIIIAILLLLVYNSMPNKKITEMPLASTLNDEDLIAIIQDPSTDPTNYKSTLSTLYDYLVTKGLLNDRITNITYTPLYNLKGASGLEPGMTYYITDVDIYVQALTTNKLSNFAIYKATLPDFQNVTTNFLGIWTSTLAGVALNKTCAWNNRMYVNITGSNGASNPASDTTNWTIIALTDSRYQTEYDPVVYDFENDYITARWDKRGNFVQSFDQSAINKFQWGNDAVFSNFIYTLSSFDIRNAVTAPQYMTVIRSSLNITDTAQCKHSVMTGGSAVTLSGASNANFLKCHEGNLTMTAGNCVDTEISRYGTVTISASGAAGSLSYYRNCNITLTGTSQILGCVIDGGSALNGIFTKTFSSESHSNKRVVRGESSNFVYPSNIALTSADTTLALPGSGFYGYYTVSISGGQANITNITGLPTSFPTPVRITNDGTNILAIVSSATILMDRYTYLLQTADDHVEFIASSGSTVKLVGSSIKFIDPGQAEAGVTAVTVGDHNQYITTLTFTNLAVGNTGGAANKAMGVLLYTMASSNTVVYDYTTMSVRLNTATVAVQTDTPDVGIGSAAATGAVALLSGTASFEDRITGQTFTDVNGTVTTVTTVPTAGAGTGIIPNAGSKALYLNVADGWAAAADITATGTVVIKWSIMM